MAWSCVPLLVLFALAMGEPPWLFQFLEQVKLIPDFKLFKNIYIFFSFFSIIIYPTYPLLHLHQLSNFYTCCLFHLDYFILRFSPNWLLSAFLVSFKYPGLKEAFWSTITPPLLHHSAPAPPPTPSSLYHRGQQTYSAKGQIMNISDFAGRSLSQPLHSAFVL